MAESPAVSKFGVGLRKPHFDEIMESHTGVDFLEIVTENFMRFGGRPRQVLERALSRFVVLPHGVGLSIGGPDPLDEDYLAHLERFLDWLDPPFYSDHLSYSSAFGVEYHDLLPLPFSREVVRHVVERVDRVQSRMGRRMLLENPSYYVEMPGAEMSEAEFITEVVRRSGCGLLLDVNNVYVNGQNHGYDPLGFIDSLPLDAVGYLHIAGHDASGEFLVDTHGDRIAPQVIELYEQTIARLGPSWTLLEWDHNIPALDLLLRENESVRVAAARALADGPARRVACAA